MLWEFLPLFGWFLGLLLGLLILTLALVYGIAWACEVPFLYYNFGHHKYLKGLEQSGFHPSQKYIRFGYGAAVDGNARKLFVATGSTRKLYDIADIQNVEGEFQKDQYHIESTLRITVRDLSTPLFEIKSYLSDGKLRSIYSLLAVLREEKPVPTTET